MAYAQSEPGAITNTTETAQNPRTSDMFMRGRLWRNGRKVVPTSSRHDGDRGRIYRMDAIDRQILAELQRDGRQTLTDLAERVQLSVSPCHRRLRALEQSGVITGYHARIAPAALGLTFEALVFVTMREATPHVHRDVRDGRRRDPERPAGPAPLRGPRLPAPRRHAGPERLPARLRRAALRPARGPAGQLHARHALRRRGPPAAAVGAQANGTALSRVRRSIRSR